jgi:hypothetical protein
MGIVHKEEREVSDQSTSTSTHILTCSHGNTAHCTVPRLYAFVSGNEFLPGPFRFLKSCCVMVVYEDNLCQAFLIHVLGVVRQGG